MWLSIFSFVFFLAIFPGCPGSAHPIGHTRKSYATAGKKLINPQLFRKIEKEKAGPNKKKRKITLQKRLQTVYP
jgi:hypothetical protein